MSGRAVVLLHGLARSSRSMGPLRRPFEQLGYLVVPFEYASTWLRIEQIAAYLHRFLESLEGIDELNLVVHSMGGLVVRAYLREHRDPRIRRMVMLGVPNRGAELADRLSRYPLYRLIFGPAGMQLITGPAGIVHQLPEPDFPFAVIAGCRGSPRGFNPFIPGDDDGTVTVESTKLPGMADFMTVRCLHALLMMCRPVIEASVRFIATGRLR